MLTLCVTVSGRTVLSQSLGLFTVCMCVCVFGFFCAEHCIFLSAICKTHFVEIWLGIILLEQNSFVNRGFTIILNLQKSYKYETKVFPSSSWHSVSEHFFLLHGPCSSFSIFWFFCNPEGLPFPESNQFLTWQAASPGLIFHIQTH